VPKVRDAIRLVERDGWLLDRIVGSHRQYRHPVKPGTVTIPGQPGKDLPPRYVEQHSQAGRFEVRKGTVKYVVVYEQTPNNWAAYVPDLPGCVAVGDSREETERLIREAVALHIESLVAHGDPVPAPGAWTGIVDVPSTAASAGGRQ